MNSGKEKKKELTTQFAQIAPDRWGEWVSHIILPKQDIFQTDGNNPIDHIIAQMAHTIAMNKPYFGVLSYYYCLLHWHMLYSWSQETEKHLSDMVVSKTLIAKVDRPAGIVSFQTIKDSNETLNGWAVNIEKLLDLVEKSCHQIHRETMVHRVTLKA